MTTSDRKSCDTERSVTRDAGVDRIRDAGPVRVILFPTEASVLGRKKIEDAIDRVMSKK